MLKALIDGVSFNKRIFAALLTLSLIYLMPVIAADMSYADDHYRLTGAGGYWSMDGRPFADLFYSLLAMGGHIPDMFPFPLLLAVVGFSAVGAMVYHRLALQGELIFALSFSMILFSPFFLANIYFRFDGAFMLLSAAAAAAPFAYPATSRAGWLAGALALTVCAGLFQASLAIFICLAGVEFAIRSHQALAFRALAIITGLRILQLLSAALIYGGVMSPMLPLHSYAREYSQLLSLDAHLPSRLWRHVLASWETVTLLFAGPPGAAILAVLVTIVLVIALGCIRRRDRLKGLSVLAVVSIPLSISTLGIVIFSANPLMYPRTYVGVGAVIFGLLIIATTFGPWARRASLGAACVLALIFLLVNIVLTNGQVADHQRQKEIAVSLVNDMALLDVPETSSLTVVGRAAKPPSTRHAIRWFPLAARITQSLYSDGYDGALFSLRLAGGSAGLQMSSAETRDTAKRAIIDSEPSLRRANYDLYVVDGAPVVVFEN